MKVEGSDDDCEGIGSNDDYDWATATSDAIAVPATSGYGSWSATTSGYALKFEVSGTWTVTYTA